MGSTGWIRKDRHLRKRKPEDGHPRFLYCKVKLTMQRAQDVLYNHQNDGFCKDILFKRSESRRSIWFITCGCSDELCNQQTVYKRRIILGSPNRK